MSPSPGCDTAGAPGIERLNVGVGVGRSGIRSHAAAFGFALAISVGGGGGLRTAVAADVDITTDQTAGVNLNLFAGTTARVFPGVTVSNSNVADTLTATAQAWFLTNQGTIRNVTGNDAIQFSLGGSVTNEVGATIFSQSASGIRITGAPGAVVNQGTIQSSGIADVVALTGGGSVSNAAGATISTATANQGAVSISGGTTRTVTNSGTISNTANAAFATGVLIQGAGATNTITNNAGGQIFGGFNGVFTSSTAAITLNNSGSITSNRGSAIEATLGGTITNTGTITNNNLGAAAQQNGILIRNTAAAEIINSGTITGGINAINFTLAGGGAVGATHTVRLRTGSVLNGNVLGGTGTDNLILEGTGSETISKFANFETLAMNGSDWTLNGAGTFSASTTVQAGTLRISGQLASPAVTVLNGGTLTGNGTVIGAVTNSGNVRVDSGTLTVNGNYVHQNGATFTVGITPAASGLLAITGGGNTATINGGNVSVLASIGAYPLNSVYTILSAQGGRTGTFNGVTTNLAFLSPTLTYDANNVFLTIVRNSLDYAAIGNTPNQRAAGGGLELLGLTNPMALAALFFTPDQARSAFDLVSGEIHPSLRSAMIEDSRFIRDAILGRLSRIASTPSLPPSAAENLMPYQADTALAKRRRITKAEPQWPIKAEPSKPVYAAWAHGYGNWAQRNGDGNAAALRYNTGGGFGGLDVTLNNRWRFGFAAGGGSTSASVAARASSGTIDTAHMGVYGGTQVGAFAFKGGLAYARHDVTTSRTIAFGTFGDFTRASYRGSTSQAFGEIAWRIPVAPLPLETFANVAYVRASTGGITEAGGPAALRIAGASSDTVYTTLGIRGSKVLTIAPWPVVVAGSLGWQHAWAHSAPLSSMAFADSPSPFAISGVPIAADALAAEASADALIRPNAMLGVSYSGRVAGTARSHAAKGRFVYRF